MATRTAQIIIDVDDRSLIELNTQIKDLEKSMKNLKIGTEEWNAANKRLGDLKNKFNTATNEAKKLQDVVKDISGTEQLRAITKLGNGLVGTFTAVSGSLKMLGINSEAFDEMTAKATTLMSIMGGLNQISQTFSKTNLAGLASIGKGFGNLVKTVKTASTAIKASLAATGIGLLVVAVGALIANWDKVKKVVGELDFSMKGTTKGATNLGMQLGENATLTGRQRRELEKATELEKEQIKAIQDKIAAQKSVTENLRTQNEYNDKSKEIAESQRKEIELLIELEEKRIESLNNQNLLIDTQSRKAKGIEADKFKAQKESNNALIESSKNEEERLKLLLKQAKLYEKVADKVDKVNERIRINQNELTVLSSIQNESQRIYEEQLENIELQIVNIRKLKDENGRITKEQQDQVDALWAQWEALRNQNDERRKQLAIQLKELGYARSLQDALADSAETSAEFNIQLSERINLLEQQNDAYENELKLVEEEYKRYQKLDKLKQELINFDKKGAEYVADMAENARLADDNFSYIRDSLVEVLELNEKDKGLFAAKITYAAQEIGYAERLSDATIARLEHEKKILELRKTGAENTIKELEWNNKIVENQTTYYTKELARKQLELENAKNAEERAVKLAEVIELEAKLDELTAENLSNNQGIVDAKNEIATLNNEILGTEREISKETQNKLDYETEVTEQLKQQAEWHERANDWLNQYAQEIQAVRDILMNSMAMMAAFQDRKADEAQERIDELTEQLNELEENEDERNSKLKDYYDLLKDANGERYDELMRLIAEEEKANIAAQENEDKTRQEIEARIKDEENKKLAAEARAAKWRKAAALVDAIVQGALSVIKALPNVFLAAATGVAAATGAATIAAQKTPPVPEGYASGGVVDKGGLIMVGEKGFELAEVPAKTRIYNHEDSVAMLASGRLPKAAFAEGGTYTPPAVSTGSSNLIDYDRLISGIANAIKTMPNPQVSVLKINEAQREVKVTKKLAGL